jgi:hypothetical protein
VNSPVSNNVPASPQQRQLSTFGKIVEFCINVTKQSDSPSSRSGVGRKEPSPDKSQSGKGWSFFSSGSSTPPRPPNVTQPFVSPQLTPKVPPVDSPQYRTPNNGS